MSTQEVYEGTVLDVFSGDDLTVMIDLRVDDLHKKRRIRLHGVDTPNGTGAAASSEAGKLRAHVRQLCHRRRVRLTIMSKGMASWVAIVEVLGSDAPHNINQDLINQGYAFVRER